VGAAPGTGDAYASIKIEGLQNFLDGINELPAIWKRYLKAPLRTAATLITAKAASNAEAIAGANSQGGIGKTSIRVSGWRVRITWTEAWAGVHEFGKHYQRGGSHSPGTVIMTGSTPRFAYKAWAGVRPGFGDMVMASLTKAIEEPGYFGATMEDVS
jgi:hypothetical protein